MGNLIDGKSIWDESNGFVTRNLGSWSDDPLVTSLTHDSANSCVMQVVVVAIVRVAVVVVSSSVSSINKLSLVIVGSFSCYWSSTCPGVPISITLSTPNDSPVDNVFSDTRDFDHDFFSRFIENPDDRAALINKITDIPTSVESDVDNQNIDNHSMDFDHDQSPLVDLIIMLRRQLNLM
nr:hypothetical protein [Tanacetum cinerariifolium]